MKIIVRAKPGAKRPYVKETTDLFDGGVRRFVVAVGERAVEGKANRAIERAVAEHLGVAVSRVRIVSGHMAKEKTLEVA